LPHAPTSCCFLAPFCDDEGLSKFVQPYFDWIVQWHKISAEDSLDRGGVERLVGHVLWLAKMTSFYPSGILDRYLADVITSLRSVIFGGSESGFTAKGENRRMLIYAAFEFFTNVREFPAPVAENVDDVKKFLKVLTAALEEGKEIGEDELELKTFRDIYKLRYVEFCKRHILKP